MKRLGLRRILGEVQRCAHVKGEPGSLPMASQLNKEYPMTLQQFRNCRRTKWTTATAALALVILLLGATPATADAASYQAHDYIKQSASTTGAAATCQLRTFASNYYDGPNSARITCQLSDTLADSRPVYVEWWQDYFAHRRMHNAQGPGTTVTVYDNRSAGGAYFIVYFKVCRGVQLGTVGTPNCSATMSWRVY